MRWRSGILILLLLLMPTVVLLVFTFVGPWAKSLALLESEGGMRSLNPIPSTEIQRIYAAHRLLFRGDYYSRHDVAPSQLSVSAKFNRTLADDDGMEDGYVVVGIETEDVPKRRSKHLGAKNARHVVANEQTWREALEQAYLFAPSRVNTTFGEILEILSIPTRYVSLPWVYGFRGFVGKVTATLYQKIWTEFSRKQGEDKRSRRRIYEILNILMPFRRGPSEHRFVRVCSSYGLFCNNLIVVAKAYVFAGLYNRTLVLPRSFFLIWDKTELDKGPVRVITTTEYSQLRIPPEQEGCLHDTDTYCCRFARDALWTPTQYTTLVVHARTLFHSLDPFNFMNISGRTCLCLFKYLQPVPLLQNEATKTLSKLPSRFLAVHLRNKMTALTRESCANHLLPWAYWYNVVMNRTWLVTGDECTMAPSYVKCYRNDSESKFFLGTDNVNQTTTKMLVEMGAVRHTPSATVLAYADSLEKLVRGMGSLPLAVIDIAIMTHGIEFIGNPLSSFSGVICGIRTSRFGFRCINSPPLLYEDQCIGYPDTRHLFGTWEHTASNHKTKLAQIKWNLTSCKRISP